MALASGFERELARLSATFVSLPADTIDAHVDVALGRVAEFFDLDRVTVGQRVDAGGAIRITHHWVREGHAPIQQVERFVPPDIRLWLWGRLISGNPVVFSRPEELPPEAERDKEFFREVGARSAAIFPMLVAGELVGGLAFSVLRRERAWPSSVVEQLRLVAETVGSALARKQADLAMRRAVEFERLVAELAAAFVHLPVEAMDDHIVRAMGRVAEFLGADRAALFQLSAASGTVTRTHQWVREGVPRAPESERGEAFPWLLARVVERREAIAFTHLDELPLAAARDMTELQRLGVRSGALIPLLAGDRLVGFLGLASVQREQRWSSEMLARLQLVGTVLASALARRLGETTLRATLAENARLQERLAAENGYLQREVIEAQDFGDIVGQSAPLRIVLNQLEQVAGTDAPVLLLGETGTGKELVAREIHARSRRSRAPLIAINCAALPATLVESELFGHEKGAFTGATQAKPGRFELADGGTLFLDEIGDLELALQTKLLRALQEGEIQRLGSTETRKVDVRLIAATNRDLSQAMQKGHFRPDLYYRLAVFPITLPALRERPEDIPLLVWHFVESRQRAMRRVIRKVPRAAMDALVAYDWPGNIRELQNVIERALILSPGPVLQIDEALGPAARGGRVGARRPSSETLHETERAHILRILQHCGWMIEGRGRAAERLGLRPSTLRNRMRKLGIHRPAR